MDLIEKGKTHYEEVLYSLEQLRDKVKSKVAKKRARKEILRRMMDCSVFKLDIGINDVRVEMKQKLESQKDMAIGSAKEKLDNSTGKLRVVYRNTFMDKAKRKVHEVPVQMLNYAESSLKEFRVLKQKYEHWFNEKIASESDIASSATLSLAKAFLANVPLTKVDIPLDDKAGSILAVEEW